MRSLAINIASFAHQLKKVDFDAMVDHWTLIHIIKNKVEPAITRLKRLLDTELLLIKPVLYKRKRHDS